MALYRVTWTIDLEADDEREAAELALDIHRDPDSIATCFAVEREGSGNVVQVDLEPAEDSACDHVWRAPEPWRLGEPLEVGGVCAKCGAFAS